MDVFDNFGQVCFKTTALQTKLSSSPVENKPVR